MTPEDRATLEATVRRAMRARDLRIAPELAWWEKLLETGHREWWRPWFGGIGERWEYEGADGQWHRYWRRNGSVPEEALP